MNNGDMEKEEEEEASDNNDNNNNNDDENNDENNNDDNNKNRNNQRKDQNSDGLSIEQADALFEWVEFNSFNEYSCANIHFIINIFIHWYIHLFTQ